ncbi:MAG: DUF349 domain-containing protein [Bacteroidales bacterium]|nr:DUF349 domain-containing protein [Bacteroidales bacterium]
MELRESSQFNADEQRDVTLNESAPTDAVKVETVNETHTDEPVENDSPLTRQLILERLKTVAEMDAAEISSDEVARLKQQYYLRRSEENASAEVNTEEAFTITSTDDREEEFKSLLNAIKEKKAAYRSAVEAEQEHNLALKKEIIARLTELSDDTDNVNRVITEARELQAKFKTIGEVNPTNSSEIWKQYQEACERFYDQLKINKELRDYDFKKNLGEKELLISEASKLLEEQDIIVAFRRLQVLHEKWREIGPVTKELREDVWNRFKDISAQINKTYQQFFEERKARERANEEAKTALCERVEALDFSTLSTYSAWDEMTRTILDAQNEWKKLGFASRKNNNILFARFRSICDKFFAAKAEFFKTMKDALASNLEKKTALCEEAESLKESTDWAKTTNRLVAMQKEWKSIGPVAKKYSETLWRRFLAACDYFFDQKKKSTSDARKVEQDNLKTKKALIEELKELETKDLDRNELLKSIRDLQARWQQTGHVPFSEKDKVLKEYRAVVDRLYDSLGSRDKRKNAENFSTKIDEIGDDTQRLYRERERVARICDQRRNELSTYENNLLFFNSKSKTGESMLRDLNRKIQRIKDDIAELEEKLKLIDSKLR